MKRWSFCLGQKEAGLSHSSNAGYSTGVPAKSDRSECSGWRERGIVEWHAPHQYLRPSLFKPKAVIFNAFGPFMILYELVSGGGVLPTEYILTASLRRG